MAGKRTDFYEKHRSRSGISGIGKGQHREVKQISPEELKKKKDYVPPPWLMLVDLVPEKFVDALIDEIPQCLGRKRGDLPDRDKLAIAEAVWHWRGFRTVSQIHSVSTQDQLRTLRGIAIEKDDLSVLASYRQCDAYTKAEIQESLRKASEERLPASAVWLSQDAINAFRQSRMRIFRSLEKEPDALRQAALSAADKLSGHPGRSRSEYQRGFAKTCLELWVQMGGDPSATPWGRTGMSPLLRFGCLLFDVLEWSHEKPERSFDARKVRSLLTSARG